MSTIPYTWCGLSANLEYRSEMCTTLSDYIFATKACIDNWKKNLLNSHIFSRCPHSMVKLGPLMAEIGSAVWGTPPNFNVFHALASLLQWRRSLEANQTLYDVLLSPGLVHHIYIFGGCCPLTEFCHVQYSLCVRILCSPILAALLHGTPAVASAKLCGAEQREPPTFGRTGITLGIGPHSSCVWF